jgi:hypothetical protein
MKIERNFQPSCSEFSYTLYNQRNDQSEKIVKALCEYRAAYRKDDETEDDYKIRLQILRDNVIVLFGLTNIVNLGEMVDYVREASITIREYVSEESDIHYVEGWGNEWDFGEHFRDLILSLGYQQLGPGELHED